MLSNTVVLENGNVVLARYGAFGCRLLGDVSRDFRPETPKLNNYLLLFKLLLFAAEYKSDRTKNRASCKNTARLRDTADILKRNIVDVVNRVIRRAECF